MSIHLPGLPALFARLVPQRAPQPLAPAGTTWAARCGTALTLRPVCPADATLLAELFEDGLSAASRRLRFHAAVRSLSPVQLAWLAKADFRSHAAFIVTWQADGLAHAVAEGRWVRTGVSAGAEFALSVGDAWQHQGIGGRLLRSLVDHARRQGLDSLVGDVMPGNQPMQALARRLHFDCSPHPDDGDLLQAALPLARQAQALLPARWFH